MDILCHNVSLVYDNCLISTGPHSITGVSLQRVLEMRLKTRLLPQSHEGAEEKISILLFFDGVCPCVFVARLFDYVSRES